MDDILKKFFLGVLCEHEYSCYGAYLWKLRLDGDYH